MNKGRRESDCSYIINIIISMIKDYYHYYMARFTIVKKSKGLKGGSRTVYLNALGRGVSAR